jgi:hypothetical protein
MCSCLEFQTNETLKNRGKTAKRWTRPKKIVDRGDRMILCCAVRADGVTSPQVSGRDYGGRLSVSATTNARSVAGKSTLDARRCLKGAAVARS